MYQPKFCWIITFEGTSDCTGKTSLITEFNRITNYSCILRDRGSLSVRAYAEKFNRQLSPTILDREKEIESSKCHLLVYLTASKKDVIKRQEKKNDGWNSKDYSKDKKLFNKALKKSAYKRIIKLNSSKLSLDEEVRKILLKIKKYEEKM
jgi:hypothetical protein